MRRLTSIVAVNPEGVIGLGNSLPWRVRSDLRFFKAQTSSNIVIMGRKTHDSLGGCLPNRRNIVISHQLSLFESTPDCVLQYGIFDALVEAEAAPASFSEIFIIGGSSMYKQFSTLVDRYLVTVVEKSVPNGDAFFDQSIIGDDTNWQINKIACGEANSEGDEANFAIFEMTAKDIDKRREARQQGIREISEKIRSHSSRSRGAKPSVKTAPDTYVETLF